jgi:hypothetical protein
MLTRAEKAAKTRKRNDWRKAKNALPVQLRCESNGKSRMVDGHEAVTDATVDWDAVRKEVLRRSGGFCECGCGLSFLCAGLHLHHWKGRTRGNSCHCAFHIQGLTPACHRAAHTHRLGKPYRSKA